MGDAVRLWSTMPVGSAFALLIVVVEEHAGTPFGEGQFARNAFQALVILVVNSALMYAGRLGALALVPGMFFGFASYFATYFSGFGYDAGSPWAAWICVVAMNALGPDFAYLSVRLTFPVSSAKDAVARSGEGPDAAVAGPDPV
ncbi:DUF1097 domain-containing protein [Streptomyces sp. RKAG290]|uniref:DUF1097 domain-containing protein n=1 Tax=Streptomyces sp. RKAG290 TaxID=2888348 RepID=UPI002033FD4D|nr:DUF1097 domain-containing protein [Streptomyces sp. RKAG290]MCM2415486.1 DUF1097 domain-containing protein [Streptomyces sp. RKAG290]